MYKQKNVDIVEGQSSIQEEQNKKRKTRERKHISLLAVAQTKNHASLAKTKGQAGQTLFTDSCEAWQRGDTTKPSDKEEQGVLLRPSTVRANEALQASITDSRTPHTNTKQ